jgi:VCBS repeat-containing protein
LAFSAPAAADSITSIIAITDTPDAYDGTQVTIAGTVGEQSLDWRGDSLYTVDEHGRLITVLSHGDAPLVGTHVQVSGQVVVHPEGNSEIEWPPVVVEASRSVLP